MSESSNCPPAEPEDHQMTLDDSGKVNDNCIKSDAPYFGQKNPDSSLLSNTEAVKEKNRLSGEARGEESESNMSPEKQQATGDTAQPERPVNFSTYREEIDPLKTQEHGGDPLETKAEAGNAANIKKDTKENSQSNTDKTNGWVTVYDEYRKLDEDWVNQTDKYIDTLLVFAGLFSAVLTAFLVQVYTELQPDSVKHSAQILLDLSNQLHALSLSQEAFASNVSLASADQPESLVATTSLWFVSLILSLGAALFGILIKQWIREYMRWTTVFPLQHAIHIRYYRRRDLDSWHVDWIISIISECLEAGLVLFFAGLAVLLWRINGTTAHITTAFVGIVILIATITTALPAFILRCPYRTPLGLVLRKIITVFRRILFFVQAAVSAAKEAYKNHRNYYVPGPQWMRIPKLSLLLLRNQPLRISKDDSSSWHLLFASWIKSDGMLRLPQDSRQSTIDRFTSLRWLTTHRAVPDDLVEQCLSDLPGAPVALPKDEWDDGWKDDSEKERQRQGFTVHCCALLSLMRSEKEWEERKEVVDFEKLLVATLPDRTQDMDEASLPAAYKNIDVYSLSNAVQRANERSRNMLSTYFLSLTKDLLGSQQLFSQDTDFDLVKNLLRILVLLWLGSDYQSAQMSRRINLDDMNTNPAAQSFYWLQQIFNYLLLNFGSEQSTSYDSQTTYNFIICTLSNDYYQWFNTEQWIWPVKGSFLNAHIITSRNDVGIINVMKTAKRFVEYNREAFSPPDNADVLYDGHQSKIKKLTEVFWDTARFVLQFYDKKHPNIPVEDCQAFLTAFQTVLRASARTSIALQGWNHAYFAPYVLRHRSHLPDGFVSTLREAESKGVISISNMLRLLEDEYDRDITEGIWTPEKFWRALENPNEPILPDPQPLPNE